MSIDTGAGPCLLSKLQCTGSFHLKLVDLINRLVPLHVSHSASVKFLININGIPECTSVGIPRETGAGNENCHSPQRHVQHRRYGTMCGIVARFEQSCVRRMRMFLFCHLKGVSHPGEKKYGVWVQSLSSGASNYHAGRSPTFRRKI